MGQPLIVQQLEELRRAAQEELGQINRALAALSGKSRDVLIRPRHQFSESGKRRIALAQRVRWAKWRAQKQKPHWTQRPENKSKVKRVLASMQGGKG